MCMCKVVGIFVQGHMWIVVLYLHMKYLAHVVYLWHLRGILVFSMYMVLTHFPSDDYLEVLHDFLCQWEFWCLHQCHVPPTVPWYHVMLMHMASHYQKVMLDLISIILMKGMQWCNWHNVTLTLASVASHGQKVMWHLIFSCVDIRRAVVLLTKILASCDASASSNGFTWPSNPCCTSFWSCWPKEFNGSIDDAISIIWCQWQWYHMTKRSMLQVISTVDLWNEMVPLTMPFAWHDTKAIGVTSWSWLNKCSDSLCNARWPKMMLIWLHYWSQ